MSRAWRATLGVALVLAAASAAARPFTVDDLLTQETLGVATFDPTGQWAIFERRDAYLAGPRFDLGQDNVLAASWLYAARTRGDGPPPLWLAASVGPGQTLGAFSPAGTRAAVFQLTDGRLRLGVVELATGKLSWLAVRPEAPWSGRQLAWLNAHELLVLATPEPGLPTRLREAGASAARLPRLWSTAARGGVAVTAVGSGRYVALRPRPAARRLVRIDVRTGAVAPVAEGEITDFEPAPGGRRVALRLAGADLQGRLGRPMHGAWGVGAQAEHLRMVDLATGHAIDPLPDADILPSLLSWSPNGAALLVFARAPDAPWTDGRFWLVDAQGQARLASAAPIHAALQWRPERVQAGWLGDAPVVLGRSTAEGPTTWFRLSARRLVPLGRGLAKPGSVVAADRGGLTVLSDARLWRLDERGGLRRVGPNVPVRPFRGFVGRDGRLARAWPSAAYVEADEGAGRRVWALRAERATPMASVGPAETVLAAAPTGLLLRREIRGGPAVLELRTAAGGVRELATLNTRLAEVDPLDVRPVDYVDPDGRPVRAWLFVPHRDPGSRPPPLIVKAYSGDTYLDWPRPKPPVLGLVADVRVLVGHGYAVLTPSLPVPDRTAREPAAGLAKRVLTAVDAAARTPQLAGAFDPDRLAIIGHSYGGYTVGAVISETDRFRAAVAQSGYFDLVSEWAGLSPTQRTRPEPGLRSNAATGGMESGQGRMGAPPWDDPARYARNSPLLAADRITTPLLLLHGDQDGNIGLEQSEAMFSALFRQGKDAQLVTYWGEGHIIASPGNVRDLYARMLAFLDAQLAFSATARTVNPAPASANAAPTPPSRRP